MKVINGEIKTSEHEQQIILSVDDDCEDCPYIHDMRLTPDQAVELATDLLNEVQYLRKPSEEETVAMEAEEERVCGECANFSECFTDFGQSHMQDSFAGSCFEE